MRKFSYVARISSELEVNESALNNIFGNSFLRNLEKYMKSLNSGWNDTTMESFWTSLSTLEEGINTFDEPFAVLDLICTAGPSDTFTMGRIQTFEKYFLQYHSIPEEQFGQGSDLYNYDPNAIEKAISIFVNVQNDSVFNELSGFMVYVAQKSAEQFTDIIPFYVQNITQILFCPNTLTVLRFLLNFIDGIEGRINVSKYGHEIFKYPKNKKNLRIITEDGTIDIQIHPENTSLYSIHNAISTIKGLPFDSFFFDENEIDKNTTTIQISETGYSNLEPSIFEAYPSYLLSNDEDFVQRAFAGLGDNKLAPILLKILHRLKLPGYEKKPSFFYQTLTDPNVSPYHYQYVTEFILYHFIGIKNHELQFELKIEMNESEYKKFSVIVGILLQNLIENRFAPIHQISSIEIIRLFHKSVFFDSDQLFNLIGQFIAYPKCQNIIFLLAQFLIDNQGDEEMNFTIIEKKLLKNLVLNVNNSNFKAMKIIIRNLEGLESFRYLAFDILNNPSKYINISLFIGKISRILFQKYPEIASEIIELPFDQLVAYPCQIICDELSELFKVQSFDPSDILSYFFEESMKERDIALKRSIWHFLSGVPETEIMRIEVIFSIVDQEFEIGFFDVNNFEPPSNYFNGLLNTGNTCYINSILQQLNSIDALFESFIASQNQELRQDINFLKFVFFEMRYKSDGTPVDPSQYCDLYQENCHDFDIHEQQDADEYLHQLFECMPREVVKLFEGKLTNMVLNNSMGSQVETSEEVFLTIPINLKKSSDLQTSLHSYLEQEQVYDEGRVTACRQIKFTKLPQILIFHLHRFDFSQDMQEKVKINSYFAFPTALNMDEFFTHPIGGDDDDDDDEHEEEEFVGFGIYRLRGVVIHVGNAIGGHYMSIVKCDFDKAKIEGESGEHWLLFNDGAVNEISELELFEMAYGDVEEGNSQNAYILFYEKIEGESGE